MLKPAQKFRSQPLDRIRTTNERLMQRKEEEKECAKGTQAIRLAADNTSWWQQLLLFHLLCPTLSLLYLHAHCACSLIICMEQYGVALGDESLANNADFFHCANQATKRPSRGQQFLQEIFVLLFSLLPFLMPMLLAMLTKLSLKSDFEVSCW